MILVTLNPRWSKRSDAYLQCPQQIDSPDRAIFNVTVTDPLIDEVNSLQLMHIGLGSDRASLHAVSSHRRHSH